MNAAPITLALDRSSTTGLCLERPDGTPATIEDALREGFTISKDDANAILSWCAAFVRSREHNAL